MSLFGDILGGLGSIIGIGSGLQSLGGGGGGSGTNVYKPSGQPAVDQLLQQLFQQYGQTQGAEAGAINPVLAQAFQQMLGLPMQQQYGALSEAAQQYQKQLAGGAGDLLDAGQQLWQTSLDPQNQLRNKLQQQVTDASRVGTSARGIGMSGEAAGIENQDVQNFLMNWQNQQLARQAQGLQGLGQATQQGGQGLTGALSMASLAPQYLQAGAAAPFQAANMYSSATNPLLQQLIAAMGAGNQYMGMGQNASNIGFGQQQTGLANLTRGLGDLSNLYGGNQGSNIPQGYGGTATDPWYG